MFDTTEKLTRAMAAGDTKAIECFYRRYFDWLYTQARRASRRDESFCLDVVQESVLRIVRTVRVVQSKAQLHAWMRLVVQTTAYDSIRSEVRRQKRQAMALTVKVDSVGPAETVDEEPEQWLKGQISRLDPELARMIELRFARRWTLRKIAGYLGLSLGTMDGRLRRALKELRNRAAEEFDEMDV